MLKPIFERFTERENTIFDFLQECKDKNLSFLVVGGYAVSAYKHRFSVDVDLIIKKEDLTQFQAVLEKKKFTHIISKKLEHVYASEFLRYQTNEELSVSVDLLIDGIGSRTTNASYSFDELQQYAKERKIVGRSKEVSVMVVDKEILIVLKLHSGRLTDFRDIVALSRDIDTSLIEKLLWRGNKEKVKEHITKLGTLLETKGFMDSFKGVFMEKKYDIDKECVLKMKEALLSH